MQLQQKASDVTSNGCNGHGLSVPYESQYESQSVSHNAKYDVNPFVHRLQFCAFSKLRVRMNFGIRSF